MSATRGDASKKRAMSTADLSSRKKKRVASLRIDCETVIIRSPRGIFPLPSRFFSRAHRTLRHCEQPRRRADGRRHRPAVPSAVQAARRGLRGVGDGRVESAPAGHGEIAASHRSPRRGRADRGPDRGRRPGADGRCGAPQRRRGAQIIDINMGCPAKKVCNAAAGSALLGNDRWSRRSWLQSCARSVPVTLKIRTGADPAHRNALAIARIAKTRAPRARRTGRTRACAYVGPVEYDTIRAVKPRCDPRDRERRHRDAGEARSGSRLHGADAIMIGRAAQGRPWIFREIRHYLDPGAHLPPPTVAEARA